jgi:alcohol dehydrogenase
MSSTLTLTHIPGSQVPVAHARGALNHLGDLAQSMENETGQKTKIKYLLLVTDPGILAAGHAARAMAALHRANFHTTLFAAVQENPTTDHVHAGLAIARGGSPSPIDLIIGLGGGSAMDCAKGINFLLTNGGQMSDYRGTNKARQPMLPLIAIPTTAGTGSEAQSFALISDPITHEKMACGDPKALPKLAILDADLLDSCPKNVAVATAIDALSHALETAASTKRNEISRTLSKQSWDLLSDAFPAVVYSQIENQKSKIENLQLGAHLAGAAIQNSMLGAAHAAANPLTRNYNITHGLAIALMLPHVIRFNTRHENPYSDLDPNPANLLHKIEQLLALAKIPTTLQHYKIPKDALPALAHQAALQWTATFNPRPVTEKDLLAIYQNAWSASQT